MYVELILSGSRKVRRNYKHQSILFGQRCEIRKYFRNILMPGSGFFNFGNTERRNAMLKAQGDKILKRNNPKNKLFTIRKRLLKNLRGQGFNIDEIWVFRQLMIRAPLVIQS